MNIAYLVQSFVAEGVDCKELCPSALELLLQLAAILCGGWDLVPTEIGCHLVWGLGSGAHRDWGTLNHITIPSVPVNLGISCCIYLESG